MHPRRLGHSVGRSRDVKQRKNTPRERVFLYRVTHHSSGERAGTFGATVAFAVSDGFFRAARGHACEERVLHGRRKAARHAVASPVCGDGERILALRTTEDHDSTLLVVVHRITSVTRDGSASAG